MNTARTRGCAAAALLAAGGFLALLSFFGATELGTFPGDLQENRAPLVVTACVIAVLLTAGGVAAAGRGSCVALASAACVALLVTWRLYTIGPALHCWSYNTVVSNPDGSYDCVDR
ncbi:hypothetical protein [Streptomyces sp. NPDC001070]